MIRALIVARAEFVAIAGSRTFLVGLLMMPVLAGIAIGLQTLAGRQADRGIHRVAIVDRSGVLYGALEAAATKHNQLAAEGGMGRGPLFLLERVEPEVPPEELTWRLSERVRAGDLFAFVVIPDSIREPLRSQPDEVLYHTETPSYATLPTWLRGTIGREASALRFATAGIGTDVIERLSRPPNVVTLDLITRDRTGAIEQPREIDSLRTFALPFAMVYVLVFAVMSATPQLLTSVVEEKMGRVSEVLLASVSPEALLTGKLLGGAAVSVLLAVFYIAGGIYLAFYFDHADLVRWSQIAWLLVFLAAAVVGSGALFIAAGAASSDVKDSQNLMQPLTLVVLLPALAAPIVALAPHARLSATLSMLPVFAPFLMPMRLAMTPAPPLWQAAVSLVVTGVSTAFLVWVSARIFRVGLLMQGKPPNLPELLRWIRQ